MKNFKKYFIIFILLFLYVMLYSFSYANNVVSDLSNSLFRLHVIANSNTKEDQNLKYLVRDELISYMNTLCSNVSSKEQAIAIANEHLDDFQKVANEVISKNGFNYSAKVQIGNFAFPTKTYGDISLPAGYYDALKVELGKAEGKNWWCVMFPSLCFIDVSSGIVDDEAKENLENNLDNESYNLISDQNNSEIKFKFKLIEFFAEKGLFTANT